MFDPKFVTETKINGMTYVVTRKGAPGHAIWGNYVRLEPGRYCVDFDISLHGEIGDPLAKQFGFVDVVADWGRQDIVKAPILAESFANGDRRLRLEFELADRTVVEPRVYVDGVQPLLVGEKPRPVRLSDRREDDDATVAATQFPDVTSPGLPEFFLSNVDRLREMHESRIWVIPHESGVILDVDGIKLHAGVLDDIRDVEHIYISNIYNLFPPRDTCVIDIGMNLGLTTLQFANRPTVKEVHSFEPFVETYQRAVANIGLNPHLASKITAYNFALSDKDEERIVRIESGLPSVVFGLFHDADNGTAMPISIRDSATALGPIIEKAVSRGLKIVAKLNCEGSEYAIFESLENAGLLQLFSAFIVEAHPNFAFKEFADLTRPLLEHDFVVIDRTLRMDGVNGLFYAVRSS
jgi:FkbM family methyltransferase